MAKRGSPGRAQTFTPQEIIDALRETMGIKMVAARRLGCHVTTLDLYLKRYPEIAAAYKEERNRIVDLAEAKLVERVQKGDSWAILFVLKTLGKDRGYAERQELAASGELTVKVVFDKHQHA
jgi:hypothetical protein